MYTDQIIPPQNLILPPSRLNKYKNLSDKQDKNRAETGFYLPK